MLLAFYKKNIVTQLKKENMAKKTAKNNKYSKMKRLTAVLAEFILCSFVV